MRFCDLKKGWVIVLSMLASAPAVRADGPIPQLPWVHEGLVLTYTWTAAQEDRWGHGTSGSGYTQVTITCIDGGKAIISVAGYSAPSPLSNNACTLLGGATTAAVDATAAGDYWIDPAKLAAMKSDTGQNLAVTSLAYPAGDHTTPAIEVQIKGPAQFADHVYDAKTGVCLHFETTSGGVITGWNSSMTDNKGDFVSMRDMNIPWSHEAMPDWTGTVKALHYRGSIVMQGSLPTPPNTLTVDLTTTGRGNGWMAMNFVSTTQYMGAPSPPPAQAAMYYGRSQFAGLWAGPAALAGLQQGQVLDVDPVTGMKTSVTNMDNNSVEIDSGNAGGELDSNYDRNTGMLLSSSYFNGISRQRWTVQYQSKE
jgi:hypothetical protein